MGKAIREARKEKGLSQSALAYSIGMEKSNLSVIENGKSNPQVLTIVRICSALEMSLDDLMGFEFDYAGFNDRPLEYEPRKHDDKSKK